MSAPAWYVGVVDQFAVGDVVVIDISVKDGAGVYLDTSLVTAKAFGIKDNSTGVKTPGTVTLLDVPTATYRCMIADSVCAGLSPLSDTTYLGQLRLVLPLGKTTCREFTLTLQDEAI